MKTPQDTTDLILELNKFSGNKIKNTDDITSLLEFYAKPDNNKLFYELIFNAKYLNGLGKILHNNMHMSRESDHEVEDDSLIKDDALEKVRSEYKTHLQNFISQLDYISQSLPMEIRKNFETKYLNQNQSSIVNITTLIYDLTWVKLFLNRK